MQYYNKTNKNIHKQICNDSGGKILQLVEKDRAIGFVCPNACIIYV